MTHLPSFPEEKSNHPRLNRTWLVRAGLGVAFMTVMAATGVASTAELTQCIKPHWADYEITQPVGNLNAAHQPMRVAGHDFRGGLGTQVDTSVAVNVNGARRFTAMAGVDDATTDRAAVNFVARADGRVLWSSGPVERGAPPVPVNLDLRGCHVLVLSTEDVGTARSRAYADWGNAEFAVNGQDPTPAAVPPVPEKPYLLTPPPPAAPRINGARVFGVRPGHPFLFQIPATGVRPMTFAADGLPPGLSLDAATGRITGVATRPGTHVVTLHATNRKGTAESRLRIVVGERIALTPPMGWNSWNCWAGTVDQAKVLASARAMVSTGLIEHGWTYINIDDSWQGARTGPDHALEPNAKFPDMKALADEVHALGLKIGIYSTPRNTSYAGYPGGTADNPEGRWIKPSERTGAERAVKGSEICRYSFANADARQWAAWGIDYLKYDWCPFHVPETREMAEALRHCGRDIVYSLSNRAPFAGAADWARLANSWRTTNDIRDSWGRLYRIWAQQEKWRPYAGPGHWNDLDMLVVGNLGWGRRLHPSRLTPNEQYTHISLWCLLSAPLLIGCPIEQMDPFTLNLLSNDEVLAIDQDALGSQARQAWVRGREEVYVKNLADGSHAVGLFNLAETPQTIRVAWSELGLATPARERDLWRQRDLPVDPTDVVATVPRHGVVLLRVWTKE